MQLASVQQWLATGQGYQEGLVILERLNPGHVLLSLFRSGESSFTRKKLLDTLIAVGEQAAKETPIRLPNIRPVPKAKPESRVQQTASLKENLLPQILQERSKEKKRLYHLKMAKRRELDPKGSIDANSKVLEAMRKLDSQIDQIWSELDLYERTGVVITDRDRSMDKASLIHRRNNARTLVSKYKGNPDKEHLLQKHETELHKIETLLLEFE